MQTELPEDIAPMIIDTDIGGDPDDTVAIVVAARKVPELALVITSDEYGGEWARFVRYLLDLVGRRDVKVVAGSDLGNSRLYFVDGLFSGRRTEAGDRFRVGGGGGVRVDVGTGPLGGDGAAVESVDAAIRAARPGGADGRDANGRRDRLPRSLACRAQFREDPDAAIRMVPALELPTLMVSDVTFNPAMEITTDSPIYKRWAEPDAPPWARILQTQCDRWMARFPGSMQHDGLTLAAATLWPGIRFARERVALDPIARMSRSVHGTEIVMSISADYTAFMSWLAAGLHGPAVKRPV